MATYQQCNCGRASIETHEGRCPHEEMVVVLDQRDRLQVEVEAWRSKKLVFSVIPKLGGDFFVMDVDHFKTIDEAVDALLSNFSEVERPSELAEIDGDSHD